MLFCDEKSSRYLWSSEAWGNLFRDIDTEVKCYIYSSRKGKIKFRLSFNWRGNDIAAKKNSSHIINEKLNGTESQRTPFSCDRAIIRYSGFFGVRSFVGPGWHRWCDRWWSGEFSQMPQKNKQLFRMNYCNRSCLYKFHQGISRDINGVNQC